MSDNFVNLSEGIAGVGRVARRHLDQGDAHLAQARRMQSASDGLSGRLIGPSGRGLQAIGQTRAGTSGGMSRQSSDIAGRNAEFGTEHARATEEAYTSAVSTHKQTSSIENDVMSTRLNAG